MRRPGLCQHAIRRRVLARFPRERAISRRRREGPFRDARVHVGQARQAHVPLLDRSRGLTCMVGWTSVMRDASPDGAGGSVSVFPEPPNTRLADQVGEVCQRTAHSIEFLGIVALAPVRSPRRAGRLVAARLLAGPAGVVPRPVHGVPGVACSVKALAVPGGTRGRVPIRLVGPMTVVVAVIFPVTGPMR